MREETRQLKTIRERIDVLISLQAIQVAGNKELGNDAKVELLTRAGFSSKEIGDFLRMRDDSVRRIRSRGKTG